MTEVIKAFQFRCPQCQVIREFAADWLQSLVSGWPYMCECGKPLLATLNMDRALFVRVVVVDEST